LQTVAKNSQKVGFTISSQVPLTTQPPFQRIAKQLPTTLKIKFSHGTPPFDPSTQIICPKTHRQLSKRIDFIVESLGAFGKHITKIRRLYRLNFMSAVEFGLHISSNNLRMRVMVKHESLRNTIGAPPGP